MNVDADSVERAPVETPPIIFAQPSTGTDSAVLDVVCAGNGQGRTNEAHIPLEIDSCSPAQSTVDEPEPTPRKSPAVSDESDFTMKSFYSILGVGVGKTPAQIKKAFNQQGEAHHPANGGDAAKYTYLTLSLIHI